MGQSGSSSAGGGSGFEGGGEYLEYLEGSSVGLHILEIEEGGPPFELFFDYITHSNNKRILSLDHFINSIQDSEIAHLIVYSSKTTRLRNVTAILKQSNNTADNNMSMTANNMSMGVGVRLCDFGTAHERVWHVLDVVKPNSPAHLAGLVADDDYILASRDATQSPLLYKNDFAALVSLFEGRQLRLWVYSISLDVVREVVIVPDSQWGGEGLLGCDIGYGHAHSISLGIKRREEEAALNDNHVLQMEPTHQSQKGPVVFEKHSSFTPGVAASRGHVHGDGSIHFDSHDAPSHDDHSHSHDAPTRSHEDLSHSHDTPHQDHSHSHDSPSHSHSEPMKPLDQHSHSHDTLSKLLDKSSERAELFKDGVHSHEVQKTAVDQGQLQKSPMMTQTSQDTLAIASK